MLLIVVLGKPSQPGSCGKALSQNQKKKTKKNQTISETYKKNLIDGLKVGVINIESTIYTF